MGKSGPQRGFSPFIGYQPFLDIYNEVTKARDAGAIGVSLAMVFVGIDTMAWLSLPAMR
jgi:hypothetical protein